MHRTTEARKKNMEKKVKRGKQATNGTNKHYSKQIKCKKKEGQRKLTNEQKQKAQGKVGMTEMTNK